MSIQTETMRKLSEHHKTVLKSSLELMSLTLSAIFPSTCL